jgi:hypothetical protein
MFLERRYTIHSKIAIIYTLKEKRINDTIVRADCEQDRASFGLE